MTFTEEILNGKLHFFVSRLEKRLNVFLRLTIKQEQFIIIIIIIIIVIIIIITTIIIISLILQIISQDLAQMLYKTGIVKYLVKIHKKKYLLWNIFFYSIPPENIKKSFVSCSANTKKVKLFIKDFFSKCDQIYSFLPIWSHLLKKSLTENFIFCAVSLN